MTVYGASLSDTLNTTSHEYIVIFLDGLKEVFLFSETLDLGQHTLIGKYFINLIEFVWFYYVLIIFKGPWFENYLNTIKPLNDSIILQMILNILEKLRKTANNQPMPLTRGNL